SRGITVNAVAPGFIDTDMTRGLNEEQRTTLLAQIPMGRLGTPEDVAAAVAYLVSPQASYVTGETLHVNGGMYIPGAVVAARVPACASGARKPPLRPACAAKQ